MNKIDKTDTLTKILSHRRFTVDVFQREYRWGRKQIEQMISDFQDTFEEFYDPDNHDTPLEVMNYGYYYIDVFFDEILFGIGLGTGISSSIDNFLSSLSGGEAIEMIQKLNDIKIELRKRVMSKAQKVGANALIGIDFESSRLGDLLMVSMTATAVRIEKIIDPLPITESSTTSLQHEKELAKKEIQEAN